MCIRDRTCTDVHVWKAQTRSTGSVDRDESSALCFSGSTANGQKYDRWATAVDRPGRPKQTESIVSAPVDPSGRPSQCLQTCTDLCTSVDRPGRPTSPKSTRSGWLVTDWSLEQKSGSENTVKNFSKNLLTLLKNPQKLVLSFYIETQTSDKNFKTYINIFKSFLSLANFIKNKTCILSN